MGMRTSLGVLATLSALGVAGSAVAAPTGLKAVAPKTAAPVAPKTSAATPTTPAPPDSAAAAPGPSAEKAPVAPGSASAGAAAPGASASAAADKDRPWAKLTKLDERLDALRTKLAERKKNLDERRDADRERVKVRWGAVAQIPAVREELRLHAMRTARLQRIEELAEVENKTAVEERAKKALDKENARHEKRMTQLASRPAGGAQ